MRTSMVLSCEFELMLKLSSIVRLDEAFRSGRQPRRDALPVLGRLRRQRVFLDRSASDAIHCAVLC